MAGVEPHSLRIPNPAEQGPQVRAETARAYADHPELVRLREPEALEELGYNADARLYIGVDKALDGADHH